MPEKIFSVNLDVNEKAFFGRQLEYIKARSYDIQYPELKATSLIPVSGEAGPGAQVITYQQFDTVGIMKVIANYADDLPRADIKGKEFSTPVRSLGGSFGYNVQEIRSAQMAGLPLQQRKANACRRAYEMKVDNIAWNARENDGANGGLRGLLQNPNVTSGAATTGDWANAARTSLEIYDDMANAVNAMIELTKGVEVPDTLLLPIAQYGIAAKKRMDTGTDTTVLEYFKRNFPMITKVDWVAKLKDVTPRPSTGAGSSDCGVLYKRSPDKLTLEIPQAYEQFPAQERNLEFVIPAHGRCGGVIIYYPLSVSIIEEL